jgi:hypothetical protein
VDTLPLQQGTAKRIPRFRFLGRQRPVVVQAQEHKFGVNLANVARPVRAHEGVGLHYFMAEMPELARHELLSATTSLPVGNVGIIEFPP